MTHLVPCARCARHVRVDEASCPFCHAQVIATPALTVPRVRMTRAAVFAGAVALSTAASACGGGLSKSDTTPTVGGVPVVQNDDQDDDRDDEVEEHDHDIAMPYGAPPSRDRRA